MKKYFAFILILMLLLSGCSSKSSGVPLEKVNGSMPSNDQSSSNQGNTINDTSSKNASNESFNYADERKIIVTGTMYMNTQNFTQTINSLNNAVEEVKGYIEKSDILGESYNNGVEKSRSANFVFRIPKDKLSAFKEEVKKCGTIISEKTDSSDISYQYADNEARLKSLRTEEERLLELLKKAAKIEDILQLENKLSEIRYQIESIEGNIRRMDNQIEYTSISIYVSEVFEKEVINKSPRNFGEKMVYGFVNSAKNIWNGFVNIIIFLTGSIPYILLICVIGYVLYKIFKKEKVKNAIFKLMHFK